jgi:hypothetical protein
MGGKDWRCSKKCTIAVAASAQEHLNVHKPYYHIHTKITHRVMLAVHAIEAVKGAIIEVERCEVAFARRTLEPQTIRTTNFGKRHPKVDLRVRLVVVMEMVMVVEVVTVVVLVVLVLVLVVVC